MITQGLEVHGKEWSFRSSASGEEAEVSGIFDCAPQGAGSCQRAVLGYEFSWQHA